MRMPKYLSKAKNLGLYAIKHPKQTLGALGVLGLGFLAGYNIGAAAHTTKSEIFSNEQYHVAYLGKEVLASIYFDGINECRQLKESTPTKSEGKAPDNSFERRVVNNFVSIMNLTAVSDNRPYNGFPPAIGSRIDPSFSVKYSWTPGGYKLAPSPGNHFTYRGKNGGEITPVVGFDPNMPFNVSSLNVSDTSPFKYTFEFLIRDVGNTKVEADEMQRFMAFVTGSICNPPEVDPETSLKRVLELYPDLDTPSYREAYLKEFSAMMR